MAERFAGNRPGNVRASFTTRVGRVANAVTGSRYTSRTQLATDVRSIADIAPNDQLLATLQRHQLLKTSFTGNLSTVEAGDFRLLPRRLDRENMFWELGETVTANFDPARQQLPNGLAGMPNLSRILVGIEIGREARAMRTQHFMQEGLKLAQDFTTGSLQLDQSRAREILTGVRDSLADIPDADVRATVERLASTIEAKLNQTTPPTDADFKELGDALGEISDIAMQFRAPQEPGSSHTILKFGSALSRLLTIGFVGSLIYLGTKTGYTNLDRAFYWAATTSLGLYAWMASNFMKILSESEDLPNLEFTQGMIAFENLPREITKRFSNGGLPAGIDALVQDYWLNLVSGNHDVILNNDPSNTFYQSTYGDAKEVWRMEKRAAVLERELRAAVPDLTPDQYRKMAGVMAMGERTVPAHYVLLEASQEAGIHLGKVTRLLFKMGERGGEYAAFDAFTRLVRDRVPSAEILTSRRNLHFVDRMGMGFFLSRDFDTTVTQMARDEGLSDATIAELADALGSYKAQYARQSLLHAARETQIDQARAEKWADAFFARLQSESNKHNIACLSRDLLLNLSSDSSRSLLASDLAREFKLDISQAHAIVDRIHANKAIEHDARALNRDFAVPLSVRAKLRDLAHLIMFHERTGDERVHEEGNFARIAQLAPDGSFTKGVVSSLPADFLTKGRKGSMAERLFLSFVARGIGEPSAQAIVDRVLDAAAQEFSTRFLAEAWEERVNRSGRPWWEMDHILFREFLEAVEQHARAAMQTEGLSAEKIDRAVEVILDAFRLHQGILNRTTDGFLSLICEDADGINQIASMLGGLAATQKKVREERDNLRETRKAIARAVFGKDDVSDDEVKSIEHIFKAIDFLVEKGIGFLRAEPRFQDGHFLSFASLAAQIPDILLGKDKLHRVMLNKKHRYMAGKFQEYLIALPDDQKKQLESIIRQLQLAGRSFSESALLEAIAQHVEAKEKRYETRERLQEQLRAASRKVDDNDPRILRIRALRASGANDEQTLREIRALESQVHQTREKVKETTMNPLTDIVIAEMEKDAAEPLADRVVARIPDILMATIAKESPIKIEPARNALGNLVVLSAQGKKMEPASDTTGVLWSTFLFFERMNERKRKGSKGANNDSGLGFYLGERIGVKLYSLLEYMTKDRIMLPPDILSVLHREFCNNTRLSADFTEDQRLKEENRMLPEQIAEDLVDIIDAGVPSRAAVDALVARWPDSNADGTPLATAPLYAIASEIAIRVHGHRVLGYVAAKEEQELRGTVETPTGRAREYADLAARYKTVDDLLDTFGSLTAGERRILKKEAALLRARIRKNERILGRIDAWFEARKASLGTENYASKLRALEEEREMRVDRLSLFHPELPWYLYPAIDQPFSKKDRFLQFLGERLQERRREFIIPGRMTAEEIAARMMTMANNRTPWKKIEDGFVRDYGKAFMEQARAIDREAPAGLLGQMLEEAAEKMKAVAPFLNTNAHERPIESERDVVRDVDTDNYLFESSQHKASAYWQKRGGRILRSYSAILQTQQFYPETSSRLSSTQNLMGVLYSNVLGKSYGKRGRQVIMGCYIVKNRKALGEVVDWIEIPFLKRQEQEFVETSMGLATDDEKKAALANYQKMKLLSEFTLLGILLGVGGAVAFSGAGLAATAAIGLTAGAAKFLLTKNPQTRFSRLMGYGLLGGVGIMAILAIAAGLWASPWLLAGSVLGGFAARQASIWLKKSKSPLLKTLGSALAPASIIASFYANPVAGAGVFFGLYHFEDMVKHLPYYFGIDTRKRFSSATYGVFDKWLLKRQTLIRMYEEEEVYSQPDDVEDFGSSPAVFQRGYHSDFHQSIDGISGDVKDKGTLDAQRGRWHGGMEGNLRPAINAFLWDRQAMSDLDWMRYILQTLGPAGSLPRLALNVNLWAFIGTGVSAFAFGVDPALIVKLLAVCSGISLLNYAAFMGTLRRSMSIYGSTHGKTSDMLAILDSLAPTNIIQWISRVRFGVTPPFLTTKSPHETVATNTGTLPAKLFPFPPILGLQNPKDGRRKVKGTDILLLNSVVQALRIRFAHIAITAGAVTLALPGLNVWEWDTSSKAGLLALISIWTFIPTYYINRGLQVAREGSSPFGTYAGIRDGSIPGKTAAQVQMELNARLQKGINSSAFPEILGKK